MPDNSRLIIKISFLKEDGQREYCYVTAHGKVHHRGYTSLFPDAFVELHLIRGCDPVLTLKDGDKLRVYYGGCPTQFNVQAAGVIENHVSYYREKYELNPKDTLEIPFDWSWEDDTDY